MLLSFLAGVGVRSAISIPVTFQATAIIAAVAIGLGLVFRKKAVVRVILFCVAMCALGILRYDLATSRQVPNAISQFNGTKQVIFTGFVANEPDIRQDQVKLTIETGSMIEKSSEKPVSGKVLITIPLYPEYSYGDVLRVTCALEQPEAFDGFAYDKYLLRYGIQSVCRRPRVALVDAGRGNPLMRYLLLAKSGFTGRIEQVLPEPEASFLGGLLVGAKHGIPPKLTEAFRATGTSHIVALSGFNITIIGVFIQNACFSIGLGRRQSFWVSLGAIALFVLMTGAQASVVRAGIMGALVLVARRIGRASRITNALVLAAALMVALNPYVLVFDVGFQLSFLSTSGLVYLSPFFEKVLKHMPDMYQIRSNLTSTLAATTATMPIIVSSFGAVSLVAPLVNILVLPLIPIAMGVGFVAGIGALLWLPLGAVLGMCAWLVLRGILFVIEAAASLSFASFSLPEVPPAAILSLYALLLFAVLWKTKKGLTRSSEGVVR